MSQTLHDFAMLLRSHGLSVTKVRQVLFAALQDSEPLTMAELYAKVSNQIDRASAYRSVKLFEELGVIHKVHVGWKYKLELSDAFSGHHHHLTCLGCGKTIDIDDEQHIDEFITKVTKHFSFKPRGHQFEIDGYCSNCQ